MIESIRKNDFKYGTKSNLTEIKTVLIKNYGMTSKETIKAAFLIF